MRILIVERDKRLAARLGRVVREEGHEAALPPSASEGERLALNDEFDLLILDLSLARFDVLALVRTLRSRGKLVPILILSGRQNGDDAIRALDAGADDCVRVPFESEELRARLRVLLRRGSGNTGTVVRFGTVSLRLLERRVFRGEREIRCTPKEFALLEYFLRNPGRVLTRTAIANQVWGFDFDWRSNIIDAFVKLIRRKLEERGEPRIIHTIRGVGFILRDAPASRE